MDGEDKEHTEGSQYFFQGAHHFGVRRLTYIEKYYANSTSGPHVDSNADLLPILDASHTRNRRTSPPDSNCLPGTRHKFLEDIRSWAEDDTFTEKCHIFWLCGPVGCGKSALSQAVSEEFAAKGRLVGSFFFFRGSGARSRISRLAVTLAAQMAEALPKTAPLIESTLSKPFGLQGASVTTQFQQLIWSPLQAVFAAGGGKYPRPSIAERLQQATTITQPSRNPKGPFLIVIDGLDECEDYDDVGEFIQQLLGFFKSNPQFPLRFLIASRIEEHIRKRISRVEVKLENLRDHLSDEDILKVVRHTFEEAAENDRIIRSYGEQWPSEDDVSLLARHANGSFIFLRTLLDFILGQGAHHHNGSTPMDRFKVALGMHPGLDDLYTETMKRAQHIPEFQSVVLTIALLTQPMSISLLSQLLDIPRPRIVGVLIPLQSIIYVPGDDTADVTLFHTSLRDFLLDERRTAQLFPPGTLHIQKDRLAYQCLQYALKLATTDTRQITEPLTFLEHQWSPYWRQLSEARLKEHYRFLSALAQPSLTAPVYEMAWALFHARIQGVLTDADLAQHRSNFLLKNQARGGRVKDILLQAFAYLAAMNTDARLVSEHPWSTRPTPHPVARSLTGSTPRFSGPDPAMHMSVVARSMQYILCGRDSDAAGEGWLERLRGYYRPGRNSDPPMNAYDYALENWAFHLAEAVRESASPADMDSLLKFLQVRCLASKTGFDIHKYRVRKKTLDANVEAAVGIIYAELPRLLSSRLGIEIARGTYFINTTEGLTAIDMLKVFWQLRLEDERHSWHLQGRVEVHIGDEHALEITSKRAADEPGTLWIDVRWCQAG